MPSLIVGLKRQFSWARIEIRSNDDVDDAPDLNFAKDLMAELARRGVDADRVLRRGLNPSILGAIYVHLFQFLGKEWDSLGWLKYLSRAIPDAEVGDFRDDVKLEDRLSAILPIAHWHIAQWILSAPLADLLEHRAPNEVYAVSSVEELPPPDREYQWLVERFTETYLESWSAFSWVAEWRYIHSERRGCCSPGHMRDRVIDDVKLARLLAEYGSAQFEKRIKSQSNHVQRFSVKQFTLFAIDAIKRGERSEAVSVFRTLSRVSPNNWEVANNLGFCLIPDEPNEAVEWLKKAISSPYHPESLLPRTYLNLAFAQFECGLRHEALKSIYEARSRGGAKYAFSAYMWDPDRRAVVHNFGSFDEYTQLLEERIVSEDRNVMES